MKIFLLSFTILILFVAQSAGQDLDKNKNQEPTLEQVFEQAVASVNEALETVESSSKQYLQSVDVSSAGIMKVTVEEIGKRGKSLLKTYEFNAADIDRQTLRATAKKDLILLPMNALRKQKLIKKTVGERKVSYVNKFSIYARNINNGRELEDLIKETMPYALKISEQRLSVSSYADHISWLEENIGEVNLTKENYSQTFKAVPGYPGSIKFEKSISTSRSAKTKTYIFNLSTLNVSSVLYSMSGEKFGISVSTKNALKLIKYLEDGKQKNYVKKITIICESVEQARDVQKVLKGVIPKASKKLNAEIKGVDSFEKGTEILNSKAGTIQINSSSVYQYCKGDCLMEFSAEVAANGKTKQDVYQFNMIDLNKHSIKIDSKGIFLFLLVETQKKEKYIKFYRDGSQESYTKSFKIFVPNIEEAIVLKKVFSDLIGICIKNRKSFVAPPKNEMYKMLKEHVGDVEDGKTQYLQEIDIVKDGTVLKFKSTFVTEKLSKGKRYEVNLSDLDAKSISMRTSDKSVIVTVKTNRSEKIIRYFEDGKIKSYQKSIEIRTADIEDARLIVNLLKHIIE